MLFSGISNTARFLIIICVVFCYIALPPFLDLIFESTAFFDIFNTAVLISIVFALDRNKRYVIISASLATPLICSIWLVRTTGITMLGPIGLFSGTLFFLFTAVHILKFILSREKVTLEVILGAVAVYLMQGIIWAISYGLLEKLNPGSFDFGSNALPFDTYSIVYLSFVTLTTLGFGDITPVTPTAQSLVIVEALVGQIYLVVVVAWLVGMFISERRLRINP